MLAKLIFYLMLSTLIIRVNSSSLEYTLSQTSGWNNGGCFTLSLRNDNTYVVNGWKYKLVSSNSEIINILVDDFWGCYADNDTIYDNNLIVPNGRVYGIGFCISFESYVDGNDLNLILEVVNDKNQTTTTSNSPTTTSKNPTTTNRNSTTTISQNLITTTPNKYYTTTNKCSIATTTNSNSEIDTWYGNVSLDIVEDWNGGLCANLRLKNIGNKVAKNWELFGLIKNNGVTCLVSEVWESNNLNKAGYDLSISGESQSLIFPSGVEVGPGFCINFDSSIMGSQVEFDFVLKLWFTEDEEEQDPPFVPELKNATWKSENQIRLTGSWEGGFCKTIRMFNSNEDITATQLILKLNFPESSKLKITDYWSIDRFSELDTLNSTYLGLNDITVPVLRWYNGPGFCVSYEGELNLDEVTIDVYFTGSYWTTPPVQDYEPTIPGGINAMYLPHGYFYTYKTDQFIEQEVLKLKELNIKHQYANLGMMDNNGVIPYNKYSQLAKWVRNSRLIDSEQLIIAQVNGYRSHIWDTKIHYNIAYTCKNIIQTTGVNGIHFDIEPPRTDSEFIDLLEIVREVIGEEPYISVAGSASRFSWSLDHIRNVAKYADALCPMLYDNSESITSIQGYQAWVKEAIANYNVIYNNHETRKGAEVVPILPAYSTNEWHNPDIENLQNAIPAVIEAINEGYRVKGIGVWWWYEMSELDKYTMKTEFINKF